MTEYADSTSKPRFDAAKLNFVAAQAAAAAVKQLNPCDVRERVLALLDDAADTFFSTPAPSLGALAQKLENYWGEELFADDGEAKHKRIIVGDIRRLERVHAGLEEPDANGGMDPVRIASDWTGALHAYTQCDRSAKLQAQLLSKPAPDLYAVLKKLELFWRDLTDRAANLILGDLRRFATSQPH